MNEDWWRRFPVAWHFDQPCTLVGTITDVDDIKTRDGLFPRLHIETAQGDRYIVTAAQARLLALLVELRPRRGDRIKITYLGTADKAPHGLSPTKQFDVRLKRAETPPGPVVPPQAEQAPEASNGGEGGVGQFLEEPQASPSPPAQEQAS